MMIWTELRVQVDNQDSNQVDKLERTIRHLDMENRKLRAKTLMSLQGRITAGDSVTMQGSKGSTAPDAGTRELIASLEDQVVALQAEILATAAATNKVVLRPSTHTAR
jgi:hypothetical protein